MTLLQQKYQQLVDNQQIIEDPYQRQLLDVLQTIYDQLTTKKYYLFSWLMPRSKPIKGLYMWGGVGIGKTFVMDLFFEALPFKNKMRLHFHGFMQKVQQALRKKQGQKDPLESVAADFAKQAKVLCFDEFFVSDIADAMILERLFSSLFSKGVVLIATSNISPDLLYYKGLHRKRFLPAIKLIKQHCQIIDIQSQQDYRFRLLNESGVFFIPHSPASEEKMNFLFEHYSQNTYQENAILTIENRAITTKKLAQDTVWFDFDIICHTPRSQVDYLKIAKRFSIVFISKLPIIKALDRATITYLIHLVDVFYDNHTKLILSAEAEIEDLYPEGEKIFEFQRTISRLHEMRSEYYLRDSSISLTHKRNGTSLP